MPPIKKQKKKNAPLAAVAVAPKPTLGFLPLETLPLSTLFQHLGRLCRIRGDLCYVTDVLPHKSGLDLFYLLAHQNLKPSDLAPILLFGPAQPNIIRVHFTKGAGTPPNTQYVFTQQPTQVELLLPFKV